MIFAAGKGTRLKPLTDTMPKALVEVGGQPLLKTILMKLHDAGATRIVVNVHHFANQIKDYLRLNHNFGLDILISDETEQLLDTGGGLRKAAPLFKPDEPILIHNVDILSNVDLKAFYDQSCRNSFDATLLVSLRQTQRYFVFDNHETLVGWVNIATGEVKSPVAAIKSMSVVDISARYHLLAFSGIHVVKPSVLSAMQSWPEKFGITDFYISSCRQLRIGGSKVDGLRLLDVGKLNTLHEAESFIKTL